MNQNKNQKAILIAVGLIAMLGVLLWLGKTASVPNGNAPSPQFSASVIKAVETSYDFGTISMARGEVSRTFLVKNTGAVPVTVRKIYTSCMCTTASLRTAAGTKGPFGMPGHGIVPQINQKLEGGEEAEVIVVFDPTAHGPAGVGPINRAIYIEEASGPVLELQISADVTP